MICIHQTIILPFAAACALHNLIPKMEIVMVSIKHLQEFIIQFFYYELLVLVYIGYSKFIINHMISLISMCNTTRSYPLESRNSPDNRGTINDLYLLAQVHIYDN